MINYIKEAFCEATASRIAAHVIGFLALFVAIFVFLLKKRTQIIAAKFTTDALYCLHFILLGSYTGAIINLIGVGRGVVFYNKEKKWASSRLWCIAFIMLTLGGAALTWAGAISILPAIGSSLAVIGLWSFSTLTLRLFNLAGISLWLVYTIIIFSPSALLCNVIYIVTLIISIAREIKERLGKSKAN